MAKKLEKDSKPLVLLYDIEATNLRADFGYVLCIGWKWLGQDKVHIISIADYPLFERDCTNDAKVIEDFQKVVELADITVGHYSTKFDMPFLQARAIANGLKPFADIPAIDTWRIARYKLALSSNRLASVARLCNVEEKTAVSGTIWLRAAAGHKPSIKYVVDHCRQDVRVLEQVYHKIAALRGDRPAISTKGCPTCGSYSFQSRGIRKTIKTKMNRFSCNNCGHWWSSR